MPIKVIPLLNCSIIYKIVRNFISIVFYFTLPQELFRVHKITPYMIYGGIQQLQDKVLKTGFFVPK